MKYSVIIPTLNEEANLHRQLLYFNKIKADVEIIVSDGGSTDGSLELLKNSNFIVCTGEAGRGVQLNRGAGMAEGEILIFLHADTFLPYNAFEIIDSYFLNKDIKAATFSLKFDVNNLLLNFYTKFTKLNFLFTNFGDSSIVIRKDFFEHLGMFPDFKIMEDVEFLRRVRKYTKIRILPAHVVTSSRRFLKKGIIKTQLLSALYLTQYFLGRPPDKIYEKYYS